jgi:hypothetical protein
MKSNHLKRVEGQGELTFDKYAAPNSPPIVWPELADTGERRRNTDVEGAGA